MCIYGSSFAANRVVSDFSGLNDALSAAQPGDTILLNDGIYQISGQFALPVNTDNITIKSLSGIRENVIVQGLGMTGSVNHVFFVSANHVTIEALTLQNVSNHGIQTDVNTDYLHVTNCIFKDTYQQMLKVPYSASISDPSENGIVENCLFEYTAGVAPYYYTGGIDVHFGKNWEIRHNTFRNIQSPGGQVAEHAIHFWTRSEGTLVEQNTIINCDRGIGFGLGDIPHFNGIIRNNMISHDGSGVFPDVGIGIESSSNTRIYNNTVFMDHARYPNAIEYRFTDTSGTYIANNLANKAITSRNNGTGIVESNITTAVRTWFVNINSGDLHLADRIGSVVNQGIVIDGLTDDFDGDRRPFDGGIDIGADEYASPTVIPQINLLLSNIRKPE